MIKRSASDLMRRLESYGMKFRSFSLTHEGDYSVDDADWNYKDVPHLQYVHQLVEAVYGAVDDDYIATINLQKVLGIPLALTVFNYESARDEQTYFTTFLFFVLIIRSQYEALGELRCRVTTTYSFGAPKWLIWLFPIVRWALKRNYADLMSGDIPMRERRGLLRKWGANLTKPAESYSFHQTTLLTRQNCVFPPSAMNRSSIGVVESVIRDADCGLREVLLGRSDAWGVRMTFSDGMVAGYPRVCAHEGACLDNGKIAKGVVVCPWHAGRIPPIFAMDGSPKQGSCTFHHRGLQFTLSWDESVRCDVKNVSDVTAA